MAATHVRGYVVALSLLGFAGAWSATADDFAREQAEKQVAASLPADDPQVLALEQRERAVGARAAGVRRLIAQRRAQAREPRPVRVVYVAGGGSTTGGGGSSAGRSVSGGAPAPVAIPAPVTSTRSS